MVIDQAALVPDGLSLCQLNCHARVCIRPASADLAFSIIQALVAIREWMLQINSALT